MGLFISAILVISDTLMIFLSFWGATRLREWLVFFLGGSTYFPVYIPLIILASLGSAFLFGLQGLYPGYGLTAAKELEKTTKSLTVMFGFLAISIFTFSVFSDFPRSIFVFALGFSILSVPVIRFILRNRLSNYAIYGRPVVFASVGDKGTELYNAMKNSRRLGWRPEYYFSIKKQEMKRYLENGNNFSKMDQISQLAENNSAKIIVVAGVSFADHDRFILWLGENFRKVIIMVPNELHGSSWVVARDIEGRLGLEITYNLLSKWYAIQKRFTDVILASLLLLLILPILVMVGILIFIDSRGPVLFRQERVGQYGKRINIIKFRTMRLGAEKELQEILRSCEDAKIQYEKYHKLENDPRVTNLGKWLRKFSIDEMPQLWNVIRGELSLIGPRAYLPAETPKFGENKNLLLSVKPGLTGYWQIMGRQETTFSKRVELDIYYIINWSVWIDFHIFLKTFWVILSGRGS